MLEESKTLGFELKPSYLHTENGDPNFQRIDWSKDLYLLNKMLLQLNASLAGYYEVTFLVTSLLKRLGNYGNLCQTENLFCFVQSLGLKLAASGACAN